ncbi:MAG: hypothetical protein LBM04_12845, partial [Opitutaceae bacterium]|nr:hypothetical protein [Opitutaceae bacterium]
PPPPPPHPRDKSTLPELEAESVAIVSCLTAWAKTDDVEMAAKKTPPIIRAKTVCLFLECMGEYLGYNFREKENT